MKATIHCTKSPHLAHWVQVLINEGWKLIEHEANYIVAMNELGQSKYPAKNTTTWEITLRENNDLTAEIEVQAFCDSPFSRSRIYEEFDKLAVQAGNVETEETLKLDLLSEIRG